MMSEFRDLPLETCEFQFVHEDTVRRALALKIGRAHV